MKLQLFILFIALNSILFAQTELNILSSNRQKEEELLLHLKKKRMKF